MIETEKFMTVAHLDARTLDAWIAAGWLVPQYQTGRPQLSETDLARALLIHDLRDELGVNDEGVGVALDLIDQIHGLRRALRELVSARTGKASLRRFL